MQKSRPVLFSPAMSWAVIDGKKTQTRRAVKNPEFFGCLTGDCPHGLQALCDACMRASSPYGIVGDTLWVREEHYRFGHWREVPGVKTKTGKQKWAFIPDSDQVLFVMPPNSYRKGRHHKDPETKDWHKRLARFMPRSVCRTIVEIVDIRVERLLAISIADVEAEGIERRVIINNLGEEANAWATAEEWAEAGGKWKPYEVSHGYAPHAYGALWNRINGGDSDIAWSKNPWVWVICFKVVT